MAMSAPAALAPGLARKVKKVLSIQTDSPDFLEALGTLSGLYESNTASNRRRLRAIIEKNSVAINLEFLDQAKGVDTALADVQTGLTTLSQSCSTISSTLSGSKAATSTLLDRTDALTRDLRASKRRSATLETFLEQYQLSAAEIEVLQGEAVDEAFFAALQRVHSVHSNCRVLLRTHHQRAGLEMMDALASYQEAAYERLCRWVQAQCHSLADLDLPEVNPLLQQAAAALSQRPVLFRYCAEEVATARHNAVFQNFVTALTRGGPSGLPRPIEMHAHDPKRYLGDMFAWVHQALASEQELLASLFGDNIPAAPQPSTSGESDTSEMPAASTLLDKVFEGICRPLKARVDQLLLSNPSPLLCFQIYQLLAFYAAILEQLVKAPTTLTRTIQQVRDRAASGFQEQLRGRTDRLLRQPPPAARDVTCPAAVTEIVALLVEVAESYEGSMSAGLPTGEEDTAFGALLQGVLDPLVQVCTRSGDIMASGVVLADERPPAAPGGAPSGRPALTTAAAAAKAGLVPNAARLFLINCLAAMWSPLSCQRSCQAQASRLQSLIDTEISELVEAETARISGKTGLAAMHARVQAHSAGSGTDEGACMAQDPNLQLEAIADALRATFVAVSAPDAVPEYEQLAVPRLRVGVAKQVAASLASHYREVYAAVEEPANGYLEQGGVSAIKNTPQQTATVLGVDS